MKLKKSPVGKQIDYSGLTASVDRSAIHDFIEQNGSAKVHNVFDVSSKIAGAFLILWGIVAMVTGVILSDIPEIFGGLLPIAMGVLFFAVIPLFNQQYAESVRISRFARDNGWLYQPQLHNPSHSGVIFNVGHSRAAKDIIYLSGDDEMAAFEIGSYQYTTGSGKSRQTHNWIYCCVEMDRRMPHMLLDAKANNASLFGKSLASNLPVSLRKDQALSLEGDFDKYFTLYAPKDYERDALYIFTPDLMALLIDNAHSFDAEVVDNRFYIYIRQQGKNTSMTQPHFMYQLLSIIHVVGMKLHRQSDYYADELVGDRSIDVVATGGRRLRRRVSWVTTAIVIIVLLFQFWSVFLDLTGSR